MSLPAGDPRHGTYNGYGNRGCRCAACRQANTAYMKARGIGGYARVPCACGGVKRPEAVKCRACDLRERAADHGTESRYKGGCGCEACCAAAATARRERRHANLEATRAYDRAYRARRKQAA